MHTTKLFFSTTKYFVKNITNESHCERGEIEDIEHYLLNCNLLQTLLEELLNTVTTYCQPTFNVLLYGDANLSESENKTILSAVQKSILKTKRFWPNNNNNNNNNNSSSSSDNYNLFSNT